MLSPSVASPFIYCAVVHCRADSVCTWQMRAAWLLALAGLLAEQGRTVVGQEDYKLSDHDLRSELGLPQDYEKNAVRDAAAKSFKS